MKTIILGVGLILSIAVSAQNPLENAVKSAGIIDFKGDDTETIISAFKISSAEASSVTYSYNFEWKDGSIDDKITYVVQWYWKDITSIRIDKDLFVVELDAPAMVKETSTNNKTHATVEDVRAYNADIYFKSLEDAEAAAKWALIMVNQNGGHAEMKWIN